MDGDTTLKRIEEFNQASGGGVSVHKVARGYTLLSERTRAPRARLWPVGNGGDMVQVTLVERRALGSLRPVAGRHHGVRPRPRLCRQQDELLDTRMIHSPQIGKS